MNNNIVINYGLLPDKHKLKERKILFNGFDHHYIIPNYMPSASTNTVYKFDDSDIFFLQNYYKENLTLFYYEDLLSKYNSYYIPYIKHIEKVMEYNHTRYEIINDLQEVLNEYVYIKYVAENFKQYDNFMFISNSFRFFNQTVDLGEKNWFYHTNIYWSDRLKKKVFYDIAYSFFYIDRNKLNEIVQIADDIINDFGITSYNLNCEDVESFLDFDSEKIRYKILKSCDLTPKKFSLKKHYYKDFKKFSQRPKLDKIQFGCSDILCYFYGES